jgi:hypothetical protein
MPVSIQKPALRDLYNQITQSPTAKVDAAVLDKIVSIVGDKAANFIGMGRVSSDDVAAQLKNGQLTPEQKLAIAKKGLDAGETADLKAILSDPAFASKLDPAAANFLKAIVGLEALKNVDHVDTRPKVVADQASPQVQAANKLRELVKSGDIRKYYDAVIDAVDNPALKAEALELFKNLPVVKPGMSANDFVKAGLWTVAPRGVEEMQKSARYLPGRQLLVETTLHSKVPSRSDPNYETERKKIGEYDANGTRAVTYRATLVGEDPANKNNFLVKVDGNDTPVSVTKASVFKHNQPHTLGRDWDGTSFIKSDTLRELPYNSSRWKMDYADPLAKAKLCEIALKMDEFVQKLDFTKTKTEGAGGHLAVFGRGETAKAMVELQKSCVEVVFRSIDMKYPRDDHQPFTDPGRAPDSVGDVARQAIRGTGMCVQQSTVFGGLLTPFMDVLGCDGQYRSGNCFRNIRGATDNVYAPDGASGHGWWQVTFRPSMEMTVTDRTWNQVNLTLDRAYGFPYGDRYANRNIEGFVPADPKPTDVNVSGEISVQTMERQFSRAGDGRENHISHTQDG